MNVDYIGIQSTKTMISKEQITELALFAQHNEINILFYEGYQRDFTNSIKRYIIDEDISFSILNPVEHERIRKIVDKNKEGDDDLSIR